MSTIRSNVLLWPDVLAWLSQQDEDELVVRGETDLQDIFDLTPTEARAALRFWFGPPSEA